MLACRIMRRAPRFRGALVAALLAASPLLAAEARAQLMCGDLNDDGEVDAFDADILRDHLALAQTLDLSQSLLCDVISELREPGLEPDPADLAGACSMVDAVIDARNELALGPAPIQACALGSVADCCAEHAGIGCDVPDTVLCACAQDPSCCTVGWDAACASLACDTACAPVCAAGEAYCTGQCTDVTGDLANCGACGVTCGVVPNVLPNTSTYVCASGACDVGSCAPGFGDCTAAAGCETPPQSNGSCTLALNLGNVSDDPALNPIEATHTGLVILPGTSIWLKVHADDWIGSDWKLLAKAYALSAGLDVDLYAYKRVSGSTCTSNPAVVARPPGACNVNISGCGGGQANSDRCSVSLGSTSECVSWFETCTGFLENDESEVWIEVRHRSGGCGTFSLKVRNNGSRDTLTCATY